MKESDLIKEITNNVSKCYDEAGIKRHVSSEESSINADSYVEDVRLYIEPPLGDSFDDLSKTYNITSLCYTPFKDFYNKQGVKAIVVCSECMNTSHFGSIEEIDEYEHKCKGYVSCSSIKMGR